MREYDVIYRIVISRGKSFVNFNIIKFLGGRGKMCVKKKKKKENAILWKGFDHHSDIFLASQ